MGWFNSIKNPKIKNSKKQSDNVPTGLWKKCVSCGEVLQSQRLENNLNVCPLCDHHYRVTAQERLDIIIDNGTFFEHAKDFASTDPLKFVDKHPYATRLEKAKKNTGRKDGTICGTGMIDGRCSQTKTVETVMGC